MGDYEVLFNQESFDNIQYFLTSSFRIGLLLELYESNKTVKNLKDTLNKSESNILHYLKDLQEKEVVKRNNECYTLTSKGYLIVRHIIKFINNWDSINSTLDFWNNHVDASLSLSSILNISLWDTGELVTKDNLDYNKPSTVYTELISKSKYIKVILPVLSIYHLDAILSSLENNGGTLDLVTSNILLRNIYSSDLKERFFNLRANGQIKINATLPGTKLNKFWTCTENFSALYLIFDTGLYDDSIMLLTKDISRVNKLNELFDNYKFI